MTGPSRARVATVRAAGGLLLVVAAPLLAGAAIALVGPRPTEPDRVDLTDPRWQTVLSVRPGLVSDAIARLGGRYNTTPPDERLAIEVRYAETAGFCSGLRLLRRAAAAFVTSRRNIKAPR